MVKQFGGDANQFSLFKTRLEAAIRKEGLFYANVLKQQGVFKGMTYDLGKASDFVTVSYEDLVTRGVLGLSSLVCKDLGILSRNVLGNLGVIGESENNDDFQESELKVGEEKGQDRQGTSTSAPGTPEKQHEDAGTSLDEKSGGNEQEKKSKILQNERKLIRNIQFLFNQASEKVWGIIVERINGVVFNDIVRNGKVRRNDGIGAYNAMVDTYEKGTKVNMLLKYKQFHSLRMEKELSTFKKYDTKFEELLSYFNKLTPEEERKLLRIMVYLEGLSIDYDDFRNRIYDEALDEIPEIKKVRSRAEGHTETISMARHRESSNQSAFGAGLQRSGPMKVPWSKMSREQKLQRMLKCKNCNQTHAGGAEFCKKLCKHCKGLGKTGNDAKHNMFKCRNKKEFFRRRREANQQGQNGNFSGVGNNTSESATVAFGFIGMVSNTHNQFSEGLVGIGNLFDEFGMVSDTQNDEKLRSGEGVDMTNFRDFQLRFKEDDDQCTVKTAKVASGITRRSCSAKNEVPNQNLKNFDFQDPKFVNISKIDEVEKSNFSGNELNFLKSDKTDFTQSNSRAPRITQTSQIPKMGRQCSQARIFDDKGSNLHLGGGIDENLKNFQIPDFELRESDAIPKLHEGHPKPKLTSPNVSNTIFDRSAHIDMLDVSDSQNRHLGLEAMRQGVPTEKQDCDFGFLGNLANRGPNKLTIVDGGASWSYFDPSSCQKGAIRYTSRSKSGKIDALGEGQSIRFKGIADVGRFRNVRMCSEGIRANLISAGSICDDEQVSLIHTSHGIFKKPISRTTLEGTIQIASRNPKGTRLYHYLPRSATTGYNAAFLGGLRPTNPLVRIHRAIGHRDMKGFVREFRRGNLKCSELEKFSSKQIDNFLSDMPICRTCLECKFTRPPKATKPSVSSKARLPGHLWQIDLMHPVRPRGVEGEIGSVFVTDAKTGYGEMFNFKSKSEAIDLVINFLKPIIPRIPKAKGAVSMIAARPDSENVLLAGKDKLAEIGVQIQPGAPYSKNSLAKQDRLMGIVQRAGRALIKEGRASSREWPSAFRQAHKAEMHNPTRSNNGKSRWAAFSGQSTKDMSDFKTFYTPVFVAKEGQERKKSYRADEVSYFGFYLGQEPGGGAYVIRIPGQKKPVKRKNVIFLEDLDKSLAIRKPSELPKVAEEIVIGSEIEEANDEVEEEPQADREDEEDEHVDMSGIFHIAKQGMGSEHSTPERPAERESKHSPTTGARRSLFREQESRHSPSTGARNSLFRETKEALKEVAKGLEPDMKLKVPDDNEGSGSIVDVDVRNIVEGSRRSKNVPPLRYGFEGKQFAMLANALVSKSHEDPMLERTLKEIAMKAVEKPTPKSYWDAMKSPEAEEWRKAMDEEIKNCEDHGTWIEVQPIGNERIMPTIWTYARKTDSAGNEIKKKARITKDGRKEIYGVDYDETYSPTMPSSVMRMMFAISTEAEMFTGQFDVSGAFLYSKQKKPYFIKPPRGYRTKIPGNLLKVIMALYGDKTAPKLWYETFSKVLKNLGFIELRTAKCVYVRPREGGEADLLGLHVDDGQVSVTRKEIFDDIMRELAKIFKIKQSEIEHYVGMKIVRDLKAGTTKISNSAYCEALASTFKMTKCKPKSQPANPHVNLRPATKEEDVYDCPYREAVGALLHLQNSCRPDITQAVNRLSRYMAHPLKEHWTAVKHCLAYLIHHKDLGLVYKKSKSSASEGVKRSFVEILESMKLKLFTDSDYAMDPAERKSTTGYLIYLNDCLIDWCSRKQPVVAQSSCEAEFIAGNDGVRQAIYLRKVLHEMLVLAKGKKVDLNTLDDDAATVEWLAGTGDVIKMSAEMDNQAAIAVAKRNDFRGRVKHIDTRFYFLADVISRGKVALTHVPGEDNPSDLMTKPVKQPVWKRLINKLVS